LKPDLSENDRWKRRLLNEIVLRRFFVIEENAEGMK